MYLQFGKGIFDLTVALLGLIILAVPMALIAIFIWLTSGSPILFTQERVGKVGCAKVNLIWWLFLLGNLALI